MRKSADEQEQIISSTSYKAGGNTDTEHTPIKREKRERTLLAQNSKTNSTSDANVSLNNANEAPMKLVNQVTCDGDFTS